MVLLYFYFLERVIVLENVFLRICIGRTHRAGRARNRTICLCLGDVECLCTDRALRDKTHKFTEQKVFVVPLPARGVASSNIKETKQE